MAVIYDVIYVYIRDRYHMDTILSCMIYISTGVSY
jgi:hypothetical protein